jgi:hypothetical protein
MNALLIYGTSRPSFSPDLVSFMSALSLLYSLGERYLSRKRFFIVEAFQKVTCTAIDNTIC